MLGTTPRSVIRNPSPGKDTEHRANCEVSGPAESLVIYCTTDEYSDGCVLNNWDVQSRKVYRRFRGASCLHHEGDNHRGNIGTLCQDRLNSVC